MIKMDVAFGNENHFDVDIKAENMNMKTGFTPDKKDVPISNYCMLTNKPKINNVELQGNRELDEIGVEEANAMDILNMF